MQNVSTQGSLRSSRRLAWIDTFCFFFFFSGPQRTQGPYSPSIPKNILSLVPQIFLYLAAFECNATSDWLKHMVKPIRRCVIFTKSWKKKTKDILKNG